jgi:hypothetical protein
MWVIPDTYLPSSVSAAGYAGIERGLDLAGVEHRVTRLCGDRSLRHCEPGQQDGSRVSWIPHLFTRILKPFRQDYFETQLTSSLEAIRASRSQLRGSEPELMTLAISGPSSTTTSASSILDAYFSRTSKDISRLDCPQSSAIWKNEVTTRRGEYSARLKSAPPTSASGSTLWLTPRATDSGNGEGNETFTKRMGDRSDRVAQSLPAQVNKPKTWPTASARDWKDTPGQAQTGVNPDGSERKRIDQLARAVYADPTTTWPTPGAQDSKCRCSNTEMAKARAATGKQVGLETAAHLRAESPRVGSLNPEWVEWLMGVPTGWTALGSWETE